LFVCLFVLGILGNAASAIFVPHRAESGPSGSHFGLLAALFVEVVNAWPLLKHPGRAIAKLSLIMLALMILGLLPWVDNYAHTFGFIGGLLLSFALFPYVNFDSSAESVYPVQCHILRGASVAVFIGLLVTMQLVFYLLPDFQCEVCKRFSCLPLTPTFCSGQNIDFKTRTTMAFF